MNEYLPHKVDWNCVDVVLLDMDGTILDLAYDTHFWMEHLPLRYAQHAEISVEQSRQLLAPIFESTYGTLDWYCVDYWSEKLGVDVGAMKRETADRVAWLQGAQHFLNAVRKAGIPLWLVTNAHPKSLCLKLEQTGLHAHMDQLLTSHEFGYPKEDARFWPHFTEQQCLNPARALFVDDNLNVLQTAKTFGIGQCVAVSLPDSSQPPKVVDGDWPVVERLSELLTGL